MVERCRERRAQTGFSLIEFIVVVAVLGILVVIAIPVFGSIQSTARDDALKAAAVNGAKTVVAALALGNAVSAELGKLETDEVAVGLLDPVDGDGRFCVLATADAAHIGTISWAKSGPSCAAPFDGIGSAPTVISP